MAVTRANKIEELQDLEGAFQGAESAILVDYKGLKVPEVTELRRQVRAAGGKYKVVKNTLAIRAIKGTPFEPLTEHFAGAGLQRTQQGAALLGIDIEFEHGPAAQCVGRNPDHRGGGGVDVNQRAGIPRSDGERHERRCAEQPADLVFGRPRGDIGQRHNSFAASPDKART